MPLFLSPVCNDQTFDANGNPLTGGKIWTYLAGSSTPAATYTDDTGSTPQSNPVELNSLGYPTLGAIWLTGGISYKFIIQTAGLVTLRTIDNISGINDASVSQSEWVESGFVPTYINATSFSVPGDQTAILQINRRVRTTNTSGFIYSTITNSVFAAGVTTVTLSNDSGNLDAGLSAIAYSLMSATNPSIPGSYAKLASPVFTGNPQAPTAADGDEDASIATTAFVASGVAPIRQTVLAGPVDSNGFSAFGGSTGSTTVTASGTLTLTAANGLTNRRGQITNPSWTGLNQNGTMYLYLDIAQGGVCTTGSTTLAPTYRWGGADVVTNNQFTFNIQEMVGKVGNGSAAAQTYRVFVGEVTVAGAVVTAITWYALMGRARSASLGAPALSTQFLFNHNLGVERGRVVGVLRNITPEFSYVAGDEVVLVTSGIVANASVGIRRLAAQLWFGSNSIGIGGWGTAGGNITLASWNVHVYVDRGW